MAVGRWWHFLLYCISIFMRCLIRQATKMTGSQQAKASEKNKVSGLECSSKIRGYYEMISNFGSESVWTTDNILSVQVAT